VGDGRRRIVEAASELLGPAEVVADRSWPHGESVVLELRCAGERVIGKAYRQREKFVNERRVYERWVPAIADRAPRLLDADTDAQVALFSFVEGRPAADETRDLHRRAGRLLRRFHDVEPPVRLDGYLASLRQRFDQWVARAGRGVLGADEIDVVADCLERADALADPLGVPCHRDWQTRNWLIDDDGEPWAIDFEHARVAPWFEDVGRLWWREWRGRPDLAEAFLDGYGRQLEGEDRWWFDTMSALWHLTTIVWSDEHGDAPFLAEGRAHLRSMMTDR
jgi:hypothetical protein